jgi:hypothetical protein
MGNQVNTNNNVELLHGEAKNAVNKGFFEAFVFCRGSDRPHLTEQLRSQKLGLRGDEKDVAHWSQAVKAVKKEGLTLIEPFLTKIISINYRKEQS